MKLKFDPLPSKGYSLTIELISDGNTQRIYSSRLKTLANCEATIQRFAKYHKPGSLIATIVWNG